MKKILVPVDFSDNSLRAAFYAAEIAVGSGGTLFLIHVLDLGHEKLYQPFTLHEKFNNLMIGEAEKQLKDWKHIINRKYTSLSIHEEVVGGMPVERTVEYALERHVDVIVVGNTGAGRATRLMFGSFTNKLIRLAPVPMIAVPVDATAEVPDAIVFATSQFEHDRDLLEPAIQLARIYDALFHVVFFLDKDKENIPDYISNAVRVENYKKFLHAHYPDLHAQVKMIEGKEFGEEVEAYVQMHHADLLVMVPYAKGFFERLRSSTRKLAFQSSVPVLILASPEKTGAEKMKSVADKIL